MRRLLTIVALVCGIATAVAQADSIDVRYAGVAIETVADASFSTVSDLSFPTELAATDIPSAKLDRENRVLASVLAIVLGDFGIHHFTPATFTMVSSTPSSSGPAYLPS